LNLLPKYAPDRSPIGRFIFKLRHWPRKTAKPSIDAVCAVSVEIMDHVTSDK